MVALTSVVCVFFNQVPGCSKSGLFKAFSEYVMRQLDIVQEKNLQVKYHVSCNY